MKWLYFSSEYLLYSEITLTDWLLFCQVAIALLPNQLRSLAIAKLARQVVATQSRGDIRLNSVQIKPRLKGLLEHFPHSQGCSLPMLGVINSKGKGGVSRTKPGPCRCIGCQEHLLSLETKLFSDFEMN